LLQVETSPVLVSSLITPSLTGIPAPSSSCPISRSSPRSTRSFSGLRQRPIA